MVLFDKILQTSSSFGWHECHRRQNKWSQLKTRNYFWEVGRNIFPVLLRYSWAREMRRAADRDFLCFRLWPGREAVTEQSEAAQHLIWGQTGLSPARGVTTQLTSLASQHWPSSQLWSQHWWAGCDQVAATAARPRCRVSPVLLTLTDGELRTPRTLCLPISSIHDKTCLERLC